MASRYHSSLKQKKIRAPRGPKPGLEGEVPSSAPRGETTAPWPSAGPAGPMPFNRGTRWPIVKTTARKEGIC